MKNRKIVVVAFMLIATMLLGVGYAALTDTLSIAGTLKTDITVAMDEFDSYVYFSGTSIVTDDTGNKAVSQILDGRDDAKIEALHFTAKDQVVKAMFTITNHADNEFSALITGGNIIITNNADDHDPIFTTGWSWEENTVDTADVTLAPGESKNFWVTITLNETPQEIHNAEFTVSYTATAVEDNNS